VTSTSPTDYGNRPAWRYSIAREKFLRQWGHQATKEETDAGAGGAFAQIVHCIAMGNDGLIYVCDRQGDRVQVFGQDGQFQKEHLDQNGTPTLPDPRGTVWWIGFLARFPSRSLCT